MINSVTLSSAILANLILVITTIFIKKLLQFILNFITFLFPCHVHFYKKLFYFLLLAEIVLPPFGNRIYIANGSNVNLPWTYDFGAKIIVQRVWAFSKNGSSSDLKNLVTIIVDGKPDITNTTLNNVNIRKPATLVLKNVNLDNNGTYRFTVTPAGVSLSPFSEIVVIIKGN